MLNLNAMTSGQLGSLKDALAFLLVLTELQAGLTGKDAAKNLKAVSDKLAEVIATDKDITEKTAKVMEVSAGFDKREADILAKDSKLELKKREMDEKVLSLKNDISAISRREADIIAKEAEFKKFAEKRHGELSEWEGTLKKAQSELDSAARQAADLKAEYEGKLEVLKGKLASLQGVVGG